MATPTKTPSTTKSKKPAPKPTEPSGISPTKIVLIVVGVVLAIAAAVGIMSALDSGDDAAGLNQTQPVTISGDVLPPLPDDPEAADPALGMAAPVADGLSFDGSAVSTESSAPHLLVFLAHWCPHCQREVPVLVQWEQSGQVPEDLDVTAVSTGVDRSRPNYPPSAWLEGEGWPWPVLADSPTSEAGMVFGLNGFPYMVLTDADGNVVWRHSGEISAEDLTAAINGALPDIA
jgi:cytochrome c biogenesis protein CcmG, thiol:disulfide interchange protein DsbE